MDVRSALRLKIVILALLAAALPVNVAKAQVSNGAGAAHMHGQGAKKDSTEKHLEGVNHRGDMAMGFDHSKTTHHFRLLKDGGAIVVETNDPKDTGSRDAIRNHLKSITKMFAGGNFDLPMFIHATAPPGMKTMKRLRKSISYTYEETGKGAQARLSTQNPQALAAIHKFLRFQIKEHHTGDPMTAR